MSRKSFLPSIHAKSRDYFSARLRLRALIFLVTLLALSAMAFLVRAASLEDVQIFFPFILHGSPVTTTPAAPEVTQSATVTSTSNATPTETSTPSATQTQPSTATMQITGIVFDPEANTVQGEYVSIQNLESSSVNVNLTGWTLRDDYNHIFTFPSFSLNPGDSVNVWSEAGANTESNLYWGSDQPIWNNDTGGCASLQDAFENPIDEFCYTP